MIRQKLAKCSPTIHTVEDLGKCFIDKVMYDPRDYDEIIVVFNTYKDESQKTTRQRTEAPRESNCSVSSF